MKTRHLIPKVTSRHFLQEWDLKILAHTLYSPDQALYGYIFPPRQEAIEGMQI
jgi:hypothetical protein